MARRRLERPDEVRLFGFGLRIEPGVLHPAFFASSRLLARHVRGLDLDGRRVLEMGTGAGLAALCAARAGARVVAADVAASAVACARENAQRNGCAIETVESDLFAGLRSHGHFDAILWNPPFYPREPGGPAERAFCAGEGYSVLDGFAREAGGFLAPGGSVILVLSSDVDVRHILGLFANRGFVPRLLREERGLFERLFLYRLSR